VKSIRRMDKKSAYTGKLPRGCVLCEKGAKLVLLVSGKCSSSCCYCPLSKEKRGKDVFYANERRISRIAEAIDEAVLMDALGTGITGGDPLDAIDRTVASIRALKERFGEKHQIHLYTATADPKRINRVARAGLDEIRFHPPVAQWTRLESTAFPDAIAAAKRHGMDVGLEIPVLPDRKTELRSAIGFADAAELDFVNLNELEFSETNWKALRKLGYDVKDDISSGVAGSERLARTLLREDVAVPLHYCSSSFKDGVQLRRRIARRAKNVIKPHEILTDDGTLLKGVVETRAPAKVAAMIRDRFDVSNDLLWVDNQKRRLEVAPWVLEDIAQELKLPCYIVEEYPTADRLEVEREPLTRR
jgi:pyruvate formate-lyase activating enzyme-like uncharacterized protein